MSSTRIKKNDRVIVIAGNQEGKTGRVLRIDRVKNRVFIEGVNMRKKAMRRKSEQDQGGIIEIEASIAISNVMLLAKDGKPTRVGYRFDNNEKVRYAKRTGEAL